ncbi:Putative AC transposase [Apostasia shenzhenica]|uniref:AC transposase n=1 Tax=Apostasia shenzhenica TaxID=1088818 RepID=A0A2H9ZUQ8_9ASPA|nr:Putative AC transposase [Apostasia shenzhenica]
MILSCAALLDPRCKVKLIDYCYTKLYGDKAEDYVNNSIKILYCLFEDYKQKYIIDIDTFGSSFISTSCENISEGLEDYDTFQSRKGRPQNQKSELDLYLEEPSFEVNSDLDIFDFWSKSSMRYPTLAMMARDILTIPVSTVASESYFSIGKKIINPCRSSLKSKTVQALICLSDWTKLSTGNFIEFTIVIIFFKIF